MNVLEATMNSEKNKNYFVKSARKKHFSVKMITYFLANKPFRGTQMHTVYFQLSCHLVEESFGIAISRIFFTSNSLERNDYK